MDIGGPGVPGSASFADGSITVVGGGADIWNASDQFNFAYQTFNGDGTIIARVGAQGDSDPWAKGGVMFRNTLDANSAWALMALTPGNGATFQSRDTSGNLYYNTSGASVPDWVELVRSGSTFTRLRLDRWRQLDDGRLDDDRDEHPDLCRARRYGPTTTP